MPSTWHIGSPNEYLRSALGRDLEVMCLTVRNPIFEYLHSFTEDLLCPIWAFWTTLECNRDHEFFGHLGLCTTVPFRSLIWGHWKLRGTSVNCLPFSPSREEKHGRGAFSLYPPQHGECGWQRSPRVSIRWGEEAKGKRGCLDKTLEFPSRNSSSATPHHTGDLWLSSLPSPKNPSALVVRNSQQACPQEPQLMNQQSDN